MSIAGDCLPAPCLSGSCLCGGISYTYQGKLNEIAHCHCQQCRKAQGGAFATNAVIDETLFTLADPGGLLNRYRSSTDKVRAFCSACGSPIYSSRTSIPGTLRLRIGTLDNPIPQRASYHAFYQSKAEWFEANDAIKKFPGAKS